MRNQYKLLAEKYDIINDARRSLVTTNGPLVKVDPEDVPDVYKNNPHIMANLDKIAKYFFTKVEPEFYEDYLNGDLTLGDIYIVRCEDYNEGEGLDWMEAEDKVNKYFLKAYKKWWVIEVKNEKKRQVALNKDNPGIEMDI